MSEKRKLLVISEPLNGLNSVQNKFVFSFSRAMKDKFDVTVAATKITDDILNSYHSAQINTVFPREDIYAIDKLMSRMSWNNESSLWAEAWLREAFLSQNSRLLKDILDLKKYDYVVNTTNTISMDCDIWWIQGVSTSTAISSLAFRKKWQRFLAKIAEIGLKAPSLNTLHRIFRKSRLRVANSNYLKSYYEAMGMPVHGVVHSFPDFSAFKKRETHNGDRFALSYVGKETEVETLLRLSDNNIRIVTFGQKKLPGIADKQDRNKINFLGRVTHEQLNSLYSSAEFTVFPFTNEPLGAVPIESMACGTPVLTYDKQGPSEVVVDGETGWLAKDANELVDIGNNIWKGFNREWFSANSIRRAAQFTPRVQADRMTDFLLS